MPMLFIPLIVIHKKTAEEGTLKLWTLCTQWSGIRRIKNKSNQVHIRLVASQNSPLANIPKMEETDNTCCDMNWIHWKKHLEIKKLESEIKNLKTKMNKTFCFEMQWEEMQWELTKLRKEIEEKGKTISEIQNK